MLCEPYALLQSVLAFRRKERTYLLQNYSYHLEKNLLIIIGWYGIVWNEMTFWGWFYKMTIQDTEILDETQ